MVLARSWCLYTSPYRPPTARVRPWDTISGSLSTRCYRGIQGVIWGKMSQRVRVERT